MLNFHNPFFLKGINIWKGFKKQDLEYLDTLGNEFLVGVSKKDTIVEILIKPAGLSDALPLAEYFIRLQQALVSSESTINAVTNLVNIPNQAALDAFSTAIAFSGPLTLVGISPILALAIRHAAQHALPRTDSLESIGSISFTPSFRSVADIF